MGVARYPCPCFVKRPVKTKKMVKLGGNMSFLLGAWPHVHLDWTLLRKTLVLRVVLLCFFFFKFYKSGFLVFCRRFLRFWVFPLLPLPLPLSCFPVVPLLLPACPPWPL